MVLLWNQSFKPYYKWITFNTTTPTAVVVSTPSSGFKPYYKWITFNTNVIASNTDIALSQTVLNLIINGLPSIPEAQVKEAYQKIFMF